MKKESTKCEIPLKKIASIHEAGHAVIYHMYGHNISSIEIDDYGSGIVKVEGNYAYLGAMGLGLVILNISDPTNITFVSELALNINYPASYVVNGGSNTISVIKIADNSVAATITLNGAMFPHHIYLNPAKTKLAVAITSTDLSAGHGAHTGATAGFKIQIIDAITGTIDKEIALTKMPHNAIFNKTGSELWVGQTDDVQSKVIIYSTADWSVKNTVNVGKGLSEITFSPDGNTAFACNTTDNTVSYIDAANKSIHHTLLVGKAPIGAWP